MLATLSRVAVAVPRRPLTGAFVTVALRAPHAVKERFAHQHILFRPKSTMSDQEIVFTDKAPSRELLSRPEACGTTN